jgi:1-acyl-sn-glycerol-3-phosphate acyltransferase
VGEENIPNDGAVVFGSNHCNTLMDALVLLRTTRQKKVFIARGDIFQNPKTAKILRWLRILPIYRIRDGIGAVRDKNGDTMDQAVDVMRDQVPLYLYPEATHRTMHSLRQLSKGIFHIALDANRQFGNEKPVYIVPVGLEYGDYFRFRSTLLISYGKPINVTEYMKSHEGENEAVIINDLKAILTERMAELISFVPDDPDYDAIWEMTKIKVGERSCDLKQQMVENKEEIAKIVEFREKESEKAKSVFEKVREFTKKRREKHISIKAVARNASFGMTLLKSLLAIVGLPIFVAAAVVTCPIWIVASLIIRGLKDQAFRNTANMCVEFVLHPLISAIGVTLLFCLAPWEVAVLGTVFLYFSYVFFFDYKEFVRVLASDWRWRFNRKMMPEL